MRPAARTVARRPGLHGRLAASARTDGVALVQRRQVFAKTTPGRQTVPRNQSRNPRPGRSGRKPTSPARRPGRTLRSSRCALQTGFQPGRASPRH